MKLTMEAIRYDTVNKIHDRGDTIRYVFFWEMARAIRYDTVFLGNGQGDTIRYGKKTDDGR